MLRSNICCKNSLSHFDGGIVGRTFLKGFFILLLVAMAWPAEGALQLRTLRATLRNRQPITPLPANRQMPILLRRVGTPAAPAANPRPAINTINTRTASITGRSAHSPTTGFLPLRRQVNWGSAVGKKQRLVTFSERNPLSAIGPWHRRVFNKWYTARANYYQQFGREIPSTAFRISDYNLRREQFQITIPGNYTQDREWGLFVWVSPGPQPSLPPSWRTLLNNRGYIICELINASNNRCIFHRIGLALDARHNLVRQFNINTGRTCISGHSGGSKCAVITATCFPDQFARVITFMGCNTYVDLPGGTGKYYSAGFDRPEEDILNQAQNQSRFVLVAGQMDVVGFGAPGSNTEQTVKAYHHQFKKENYAHAHLVVVPGQGHGLPGANWLGHALNLLDREPAGPQALPGNGGNGRPALQNTARLIPAS